MGGAIFKEKDYIVVFANSNLLDNQLIELQNDLLNMLANTTTQGVIFDISFMEVVDSFTTRVIRETIEIITAYGIPSVVVGLRTEVENTMQKFELSFGPIHCANNFEEAVYYLNIRNFLQSNIGLTLSNPQKN